MKHPEPVRQLVPTGDPARLVGLTPEQARVATHGAVSLLILAGPGAGKTRTLTHRIAHSLGVLGRLVGLAPASAMDVHHVPRRPLTHSAGELPRDLVNRLRHVGVIDLRPDQVDLVFVFLSVDRLARSFQGVGMEQQRSVPRCELEQIVLIAR
jgi:hypothetical protein